MRLAIISFVIGVAYLQQQAALVSMPYQALLLLASVFFLYFSYWQRQAKTNYFISRCSLVLGSGLFGFFWAGLFGLYYLSDELPKELEGKDIVIVGVVDNLPGVSAQGIRFHFKIENTPNEASLVARLPKKIALGFYRNSSNADSDLQFKPGERWRLQVRLQRPHGNANPYGFDYEAWLLEQGVRATGTVRVGQTVKAGALENQRLDSFVWSLGAVIERGRDQLRERIHTALPEANYAGVIVALVLGDQREISAADWKVFNRSGIGHLVSISGLHITMVAGLFSGVMYFLWRHSFFTNAQLPLYVPATKIAAIAGVAMALLYVALAGFGVPAQRTLLMLIVVAVALWNDRLTSASHILCVALGIVVLLDPWAVLWPGFWLSFSAVAILLYVSGGRLPLLASGTRVDKVHHSIALAVRTQYAITVGMVPLTLLLFGQISIISPFANAIAIPIISFVVTPLALIGSVLPAPLSTWVLGFAHHCVVWLANILDVMSAFSFAVWKLPIPSAWVVALALLGTLWMLTPRGWPMRWLGIFCWFPIVMPSTAVTPENDVEVIAFDVGQGTAVLIETAHHRFLYDTGPLYSAETDSATRVLLPYFNGRGIWHLDGMMISHSDADHSGGALSLLKEIQVDHIFSSLNSTHPIVRAASAHSRCQSGQSWVWDGVQFEILHPMPVSYESDKWKPNARSCVLKISTKNNAFLLTGDIEAIQEDELVNSIPHQLSATVLLAPHHGSGTSSTPSFLKAVNPQVAIFQVGYRSRYGHPKPEVLDRYQQFRIKTLRTDMMGAITLQSKTDSSVLSIAEYRNQHARYWYSR